MQVIYISPHVTPIWTVFLCGRNWRANTIYRKLPVARSTTCKIPTALTLNSLMLGYSCLARDRATTATASSTTATLATPPSMTAIPLPTSTETKSPDVPSPAPASSQAWIAGEVIGPMVGCALIDILIWWITRYRMERTAAGSVGGANGTYHQHQPLTLWPTASPSPSHGPVISYQGWEAQNKPNSLVSGGTPSSPHELSSNQGSVSYHGEVYEMHQTRQ